MNTSVFLLIVPLLSLSGCASRPAASESREVSSTTSDQIQFFKGQIQRSSLDGRQKYGPSFESIVRRVVDQNKGRILECVFQDGKIFVTEMIRTRDPLVYSVHDLGGFSSGHLTMETATAQAWSYDVDVLKPMTGKISGSLAEGNGARIFPDGRMEIRKTWNHQVLISEKYASISEEQYLNRLAEIAPSLRTDVVERNCK